MHGTRTSRSDSFYRRFGFSRLNLSLIWIWRKRDRSLVLRLWLVQLDPRYVSLKSLEWLQPAGLLKMRVGIVTSMLP